MPNNRAIPISVPTPRAATMPTITKYMSIDGLVGWDNNVRENVGPNTLYRTFVLPLTATVTAQDAVPSSTIAAHRRAYQWYNRYFDQERGIWVTEYHEVYSPR